MLSRCAFLCVLCLFCGLSVQAAPAEDAARIYQESTTALYNLDFTIAQNGYESLTRMYPDNPDYWNALASSIWLNILYDQQKLNIESFSGGSKFGTSESGDRVSDEDEMRLRYTVATAISKANAILKKNPDDIHALYALGVSNATLASFEATAKRSYLAAHKNAKRARDLHQKVLKLDPTFDDARLSVGTYDYVIGVIPAFIRFFLAPFGIHSAGKEAGIRNLETAAAKGKKASTEARVVLTVVYSREKQYDRVLTLLDELQAKYPRNFLFELAKATTYRRMKQWDHAIAVYQHILTKINAQQDEYDRLRSGRVYYLIGTADIDRMEFDKAGEAFARVASSQDSPPNERARAYLWLGKIFDSKKERMKALEQYDALLALDCDDDIKSEAQRYKRRPYGD